MTFSTWKLPAQWRASVAEEFPSLHTAQRHFLISGLVPKSQARDRWEILTVRHGFFDGPNRNRWFTMV